MRGTISSYVCPANCGQGTFEKFAWEGDAVTCPSCDKPAARRTESHRHAGLDYSTPVVSHTLGVPVHQIAEAKRRFPHHEYTPEGHLVIRNHQERKRVLNDLGYHELADT